MCQKENKIKRLKHFIKSKEGTINIFFSNNKQIYNEDVVIEGKFNENYDRDNAIEEQPCFLNKDYQLRMAL